MSEQYSAELITDYATRTAVTVWRGKRHEHAFYDPPDNGVHLCGSSVDDAACSAAIYPMSANEARKLFALAKGAADSGDEYDFVVDLCIDGEIDQDFGTTRQLWPKAIEAWNAKAPTP